MLSPDDAKRSKNQDQEQLSVSQAPFLLNGIWHDEKYPFIQEFSGFLATVSTDSLKFKLMTYQQRLMARAMWEAENYGGSEAKCIKHLTEVYGPNWQKVTKISDHMEAERMYCEYVLILEYQKQWDNARKKATLLQDTASDDTH